MAVQIPDPGTGNGQTGDNEYVFRKKVKDNFSDQTNAASKIIGTGIGQIPTAENTFRALSSTTLTLYRTEDNKNANTLRGGDRAIISSNSPGMPPFKANNSYYEIQTTKTNISSRQRQLALGYVQPAIFLRVLFGDTDNDWGAWAEFYSTLNTTKDANGFIKAASPIIKVFADKVELNGDAESQKVMYTKNGIGDYTITTQSGLSTDGWYIELPKDMNGNPKVAIGTLDDKDGVITLKTYKRMFSMETFTFEPDLNEPLDIPDGRWIDLRLNEIPVEPSEPESEV